MDNGPYEDERRIMKRKFSYQDLPNIDYDYGVGITSLGYSYKKRRFHL